MNPISFEESTNIGVHWAPYGYYKRLVEQQHMWSDLLDYANISWVVILSEDDSALVPTDGLGGRSVVQWFLDQKVQPVVRFKVHLDRGWPVMAHVEELISQFDEYGLTPLVLIGNEPGDPREYASGKVPPGWQYKYIDYFSKHGSSVVSAGGVALFADGPGYPMDPFPHMPETWDNWVDQKMGWGGHWYGLNRPPDYPYDTVTQYGGPLLTEDDLIDWFGPFYDDAGLNDVPVGVVNRARLAYAHQGLTAIEDPTCWRGWEQVAEWMTNWFGEPGLLTLTEGGWTPGAVAGTGANRDLRFLRPTPDTVAKWTLVALQEPSIKFQCFWLMGDSVLGGAGGWDMDAWVTGWWRHGGKKYWLFMPIFEALHALNPPVPPEPENLWREYRMKTEELRALLAAG